jgi:exonuclease III
MVYDGKYSDSKSTIPNRFKHREEFDNLLQKYILKHKSKCKIIVLGDFNVSLTQIDTTLPLKGDQYEKCRERLNNLKESCDLVDTWRLRNENKICYTSYCNNHTQAARVDFILTPENLD